MFKTPKGLFEQLGFEPITDHLHDDCSTIELTSYLQRRIMLPLIYFESGDSTHYHCRRDYILVSKHLAIERVSRVALTLLHCSQIKCAQANRSFLLPFFDRLSALLDRTRFYW